MLLIAIIIDTKTVRDEAVFRVCGDMLSTN